MLHVAVAQTVAIHWAVIVGAGFAIGGIVGVAVASLIRTPTHA